METALLVAIIFLLAVISAMLFRKPQGAELSTPLQNLTQAVQQTQGQAAVLVEKVGGLAERMAKVEQSQGQANQGISALGANLAETGTLTRSLTQAAAAIHQELSRAKDDLTELQTHTRARQELEARTAESIRRLETIIAGTQTKGTAGENLLEMVFSQLPPEWQVRNFTVGNKAVEFGLRLPNNLVLPIDSKWTATNLLEQFACCEEAAEQQKLKAQIEDAVLSKAKEVRKYIDPNVTVNFGVAAVPDAVHELCGGIQCEVFRMNVVLVSYSMLVPYLLLVFQTILKTAQSIDLQKLDAYLHSAQENIKALQEELEGRFARGLTMLTNSRADMSAQLSKLSGGLTGLQIGAGGPSAALGTSKLLPNEMEELSAPALPETGS